MGNINHGSNKRAKDRRDYQQIIGRRGVFEISEKEKPRQESGETRVTDTKGEGFQEVVGAPNVKCCKLIKQEKM